MTDVSEQGPAAIEPLATEAVPQLAPLAPIAKADTYALSLWAGSQNVLLDEMVFAGNELLERATAETRIFNEFVSRLAEAHSVKDLGRMYRECAKHQLDFIRRDTERLLKHSHRMIDRTAKLAETWRQN
jgi:hypothetical protein